MKDTAYAFAVAKIRANENSLLKGSDIEQLIAASGYNSTLSILEDKGYIGEKDNQDIQAVLKEQLIKTWKLLCEISPDKSQLEFLVVKNDFHNIKAALKALVSNIKNVDYFIEPSIVNPELIKIAVLNKRFNELPGFTRDAAEKSYDVLVRTMDGQLTEIMLDSMALDYMLICAQKTENNYIKNLVELIAVTANIKTALRASRTGKDEQFLKTALCDSQTLDKATLINAAKKGSEELLNYISGTAYREAAEQIKISAASFEKWCDDILVLHLDSAKRISFGIEPLVAYYVAKETEVKTIRIILSCKQNKLPVKIIKERVRKLYV